MIKYCTIKWLCEFFFINDIFLCVYVVVVVPRVVSEIQADPVPTDPQNILLWCQFSPIPPDATIKWTKEGTVLSNINKV